MTFAHQIAAHAATHVSALHDAVGTKVRSPFDGVTPSIDAFGGAFKSKALLLLGGVWFIALMAVAGYYLIGATRMNHARRHGQQDDLMAATSDVKIALGAAGLAVGAPVVFGALIAFIG